MQADGTVKLLDNHHNAQSKMFVKKDTKKVLLMHNYVNELRDPSRTAT